ncbi:NAD-dependent protein deacetylase sirtuin-2 [Lunasporangiospora selenospora]|uniref:NAD-dependent protein deacetylase sirtuin-2 n=1 Tax=Lunasporangiospora selenospora TaxID=979761 RepID=A0A9P6KG82_9FUNG|nr:NAD-dependent protein deacetylase sirtuin-2 [Lunasporangiospora selenospora]
MFSSIESIAELIRDGKAKNIIVMTGAGISTAAGIKDFRSPGTGLYDALEEYNLPFPEAVFDLAFFKKTPQPFYKLAKHLYPGTYHPTLTHYLLPLLAKKKMLLRGYTQNIDSLERIAGLDEDLLVEAHGSFETSKCIQCDMTSDPVWVKKRILDGDVPLCKRCGSYIKPNLVFFGEDLPSRFFKMAEIDFDRCDLLIVLGTSLKVEPFNRLISKVSPKCPRLLINLEKAGEDLHSGFDFDDKWKYTILRDAYFLGNCDDGVKKLVQLCGWEEELQELYDAGVERLKEAEEQKPLTTKFKIRKGLDDDEDEQVDSDSEKDVGKQPLEAPSDSEDLDDITLRLQQSTLLSQPEVTVVVESLQEKEDAKELGLGNVTTETQLTTAKTEGGSVSSEGPSAIGSESDVNESSEKTSESGADTHPQRTPEFTLDKEVRADTPEIPTVSQPLFSQTELHELEPKAGYKPKETVVQDDNPHAPRMPAITHSDTTVSTPCPTLEVRKESESESRSEQESKGDNQSIKLNGDREEDSARHQLRVGTTNDITDAPELLVLKEQKQRELYSDTGSGTALETSVISSSSMIYIPLNADLSTTANYQSGSNCVPAPTSWTGLSTQSSSPSPLSSEGALPLLSSSLRSGNASSGASDDSCSSPIGHGIGSGNNGNKGSLHHHHILNERNLLQLKKRHREFENGAGMGASWSLRGELQQLRGPGSRHLSSVKHVPKKRRFV